MDRGTYAAASAGMMHLTKLDIINNNLANINTPGFKSQYLIAEQEEFEDTLVGQMGGNSPFAKGDHARVPAVNQVRSVTDFTPGPIQNTENDLHVALRGGKEFFVVNGPEGQLYTRAGNFTLDVEGRLVTPDGLPVAGDGGDITATGGPVSINAAGFVEVNGEQVGRLQVVTFEDPTLLERAGGTRFRVPPAAAIAPETVAEPAVIPRSLEMANVSATQAMVDLIATTKCFELYAKSAQSIDQLNEQTISRVGRRSV